MLFGNVIFDKLLQYSNACTPNVVRPFGNSTLVNAEHP